VALIARREDAEHQIHSNPQLYVGALMQQKLAQLQSEQPATDRPSFTVQR
jgi:hypothetical protein